MSSTGWLLWTLTAVMVVVALYHVGRVAGTVLRRPGGVRSRRELDVDLTHATMGVAMALMLVGDLGAGMDERLAVAFVVPATWFVWRAVHDYVMDGPRAVGHHARQAAGCVAMVYMLRAAAIVSSSHPPPVSSMSGMTGMAGMTMSGMSASSPSAAIRAAGVLVLVAMSAVAGQNLHAMVRRTLRRDARPTCSDRGPAVAESCQLVMNVTAVLMLAVAV
jgi:hypothetical protein